ncbi:hypothetical protein V1478_018975 [Vespula squamosa]|uniref:Uncharacterized protein n=1 Tax=Vespula squamosa TaxID=30214 RepID=A0ABD1ZSW5_VESSQ
MISCHTWDSLNISAVRSAPSVNQPRPTSGRRPSCTPVYLSYVFESSTEIHGSTNMKITFLTSLARI